MRKQRSYFRLFFFLLTIVGLLYWGTYHFPFWQSLINSEPIPQSQPVLNVFPFNTDIQFLHASSTLTLEQDTRDQYKIKLYTSSETTSPTYLRQDLSLVYANGVLVGRLYGWKENAVHFEQILTIKEAMSSRFNAITFHHAEIHDKRDTITSQQAMSNDQIYVLSSTFSSPSLFREAQTNTQKHWQRILDHAIQEQRLYQWKYLIDYFSIDRNQYELIPLNQLANYQAVPFPSFTEEQTKQIIGAIWEGMYRHLILGLYPSSEAETIDPEGSTMPVILLSKDGSHLKILFRTSDAQEVQIIKQINSDFLKKEEAE